MFDDQATATLSPGAAYTLAMWDLRAKQMVVSYPILALSQNFLLQKPFSSLNGPTF